MKQRKCYLIKFNEDTGKRISKTELDFYFCDGEDKEEQRDFVISLENGKEIVIPLSVVLDEMKRVMLRSWN